MSGEAKKYKGKGKGKGKKSSLSEEEGVSNGISNGHGERPWQTLSFQDTSGVGVANSDIIYCWSFLRMLKIVFAQ